MRSDKPYQKGMIFGGEMMWCRECGKKKKSDPKIESGWTAIQVNEKTFYICPECWSGFTKGLGSK